MTIQIILLIVFINCLVFSQSDHSVYNTDPGFAKNESEYLQNPSPDLEKINDPNWHEFVTNTPLNIYGAMSNSFTSDNLPVLGYLSALTTALILTDGQTHATIKTLFRNNKSLNNYSIYALDIGDGKINFGIGALFTLYGVTCSDNLAFRTGLQCNEALITNGITVQLLKRITGRESPLSASSKSGTWRFLTNIKKYQKNQPKYYSFPSGYLSTAMTTITVIADDYPGAIYIKPIGYSLTGLLGISLVFKDMHWFSDFPLAYALGYEFGKIITSHNNSSKEGNPTSHNVNISFIPVFLTNGGGINMLMSF